MKSVIDCQVYAVYSEHAYVYHPILIYEDDDLSVHNQLAKFLRQNDIGIYANHFVLGCVGHDYDSVGQHGYKFYIGFHDNKVYVGLCCSMRGDSEEIKLSENKKLMLILK